jgi:membrane-associated protein
LINPLCGIIGIPAKKFFIWNIIGSYIWTVSLITAGYLLGERLEGSVDKYLLPIVGLIVALSLAPIAVEFLRRKPKDFNL